MTVKRDLSTPDSGTAPTACSAPLGPWAGYRFDARHVFSTTSPHQRIEVVDLPAFGALGRAYRLDARFMASLADAHICHECMVHPLLLAHGDARHLTTTRSAQYTHQRGFVFRSGGFVEYALAQHTLGIGAFKELRGNPRW